MRIAAQIFARNEAEKMLGPERSWNEAFYVTVERIRAHLDRFPRAVQDRRIRFMAGHLVQATAAQVELAGASPRTHGARVRAFADDFVNYVAGALVAPACNVASRHFARRA